MGRFRHKNDSASLRFTPCGNGRLDHHQAANLTMRAGPRCHRDGIHACQDSEPAGKRSDQLQRTRHARLRLQRMDIGKAWEPCHRLVQARIMFHRAGAERIDPEVDRIILP